MIVIYIIVAIIIIVFLLALLVKKEYEVIRSININRPVNEVFSYIKFLKNQDNFSKWATMDPDMKKEYKGTDGTVGFVSAWESDNKKVGHGEQSIKKIEDDRLIEFDLHFIKPFDAWANAWMKTSPVNPGETKVEWGMNSAMKYPMNLMLLVMNMDKMIGDDFEVGLQRLKEIVEQDN
jgi:uncharacterized protein YndB with AHSA1/START domain